MQKVREEDSDTLISMEMLVSLFEHHNILATIGTTSDRTETTYFMPSILMSATKEELQKVPTSSTIAPLMLRYTCGYLPLGVFSSLIIEIVRNRELKWKLIEEGLCRNKISFRVGDDYDIVTLISYPCFIKVVVCRASHPISSNSEVCGNIRNTLTSILTEVNKSLRYHSATLEYGFECLEHWNIFRKKPFHLCIIESETSKKMLCLNNPSNPNVVFIKRSRQLVWFKKVSANQN